MYRNTHSENRLSTTAEANIHDLPSQNSWEFSQSAARKTNNSSGLAAVQTSANSVSSRIVPQYFNFPSLFF